MQEKLALNAEKSFRQNQVESMQNDYFSQILESGIRPSAQRIAVFKYILEKHNHPTVDMIYSALSAEYPNLSRTTIYNTLKAFARHGLVQTIHIEEDKLRYDANTKPHFHFKCTKCGKILDVFYGKKSDEVNSMLCGFLPDGIIARKIQTYIWGVCEECGSE